MGLFSFLQTKDINSGVRSFLATEGAVLLDVGTPEEYADPAALYKCLRDAGIGIVEDKVIQHPAIAALCPNVFADQSVAEEWHTALNLLLDLAASVPVYALACTPDERAVRALEQAMARDGLISL